MGDNFLKSLLAGMLAVALLIAAVFYFYWSNTPELAGEIQNIRTLATADDATVAIADFRFSNISTVDFIVRECRLVIEDAEGKRVAGRTISEDHTVRLFEHFPVLGQKYNPSLLIKTKIAPGEGLDRMLCSRFEMPESEFKQRRKLTLEVEELDGATSRIDAAPPAAAVR